MSLVIHMYNKGDRDITLHSTLEIDLCVLNGLQITRLCWLVLYLRSHVITCPFMAIMLPSLSPRPNLYYTRRMQRIEPIIICTLIVHNYFIGMYMYMEK